MFATFHCIAKRASTIRRIHPAGIALLARAGCPILQAAEASGVRFQDLSMGWLAPTWVELSGSRWRGRVTAYGATSPSGSGSAKVPSPALCGPTPRALKTGTLLSSRLRPGKPP